MFSTRRSRAAPAFPVMFRVITISRSRTPWGTCWFNAKWELTRVGGSAERQRAQLIQHSFSCLEVSPDLGGNALMAPLPKLLARCPRSWNHCFLHKKVSWLSSQQGRGKARFLSSGMFCCASISIFIFKFCIYYYFLFLSYFSAPLHGMWDLSSLTRGRTCAPCSGSSES